MQTVIETRTGYMIRCPKCRWHEYPKNGKPGASWTFNGDVSSPTFTPSMNEAVGPFPNGEIRRCHFTVTSGQIKFHDDCTHDLKGQTLQLEAWPQIEIDSNQMEG